MIDTGKNFETGPQEASVPSMLAKMSQTKMDTSMYKVRVDRFDLDADMDCAASLESLYTRGIDGSGDIVILKEKTFTHEDTMVVIVFYMEKRLGKDPVSVLKSMRKSEEL